MNATIPSDISYVCALLQFTWKAKDNFMDKIIITFSTESAPQKVKTPHIDYTNYKELEFGIRIILIDLYRVYHTAITDEYMSDDKNYPCTELATSTPFIWNIPENKDRDKSMKQYDLCRGYLKSISISISGVIQTCIVTLCVDYLTTNVSIGKLQRLEESAYIYSPIFMMDGFKWIMCLCVRNEKLILELKPTIIPGSISKIKAKCSLIFDELGYRFIDVLSFQGQKIKNYTINCEQIQDLQE